MRHIGLIWLLEGRDDGLSDRQDLVILNIDGSALCRPSPILIRLMRDPLVHLSRKRLQVRRLLGLIRYRSSDRRVRAARLSDGFCDGLGDGICDLRLLLFGRSFLFHYGGRLYWAHLHLLIRQKLLLSLLALVNQLCELVFYHLVL